MFNEAYLQWSVEERPRTANNTAIPEAGVYPYLAAWGQNQFLPNFLDENRIQLIDNLTFYKGQPHLQGRRQSRLRQLRRRLLPLWWRFLLLQRVGGRRDEGFLDGGLPVLLHPGFSDYDGAVKFTNNYYAVYFQDEWRATPNFTLTYGLRYEFQQHDKPKETNPLYPDTGQIPNDSNNFAPRVGFAWDIAGDGKSVLRGGIGMFYDNTPTLLDANAMLTNGVRVVRYSVTCRYNPGVCPVWPGTWNSPSDAGDAVRPDIFVYDPDFENPETLRMSLGYEREIVRNFSLGISAIWQDTKKLQRKWDQNIAPNGGTTPDGRPTYDRRANYSDFDQIMQFTSDADQEYRAIILHGQKRFADNWFLDFSYTWSSSKDHDSNERSVSSSSDFPQDQFDLSYSWGYSNFDATHKFVTSFGWQLPANFMVSGIYTWRSGFPYSALDSSDNNGDGYRNETAMVEVSPGVFELFDRNTERQPSYTTFDLRLSWTANLGKQMQLELIGEVFNLFNSSNWLVGSSNFTYGRDTFGQNSLPGSPRTFQVGAKFRF